MISRKLLVGMILIPCILFTAALANATYAGDKPLKQVLHEEMHGGYVYSVGNSTYKGSIGSGGNYTAYVNVSIPDDAVIKYQRLYVNWAWSTYNQKAIYPSYTLEESTRPGENLTQTDRYVDNKGVVGSYDFFSGMDAYELPDIKPGENNITFSILQTGPDGSSISIYGVSLLVVYESASEPMRILWVDEGADMLYSSYGITPEMSTNKVEFDGNIPIDDVSEARIFLVAPSGGYSQYDIPNMNLLQFNKIPEENLPTLMNTILSIIFPNFKGKEWPNFFFYDYISQIGTADIDIKPYLKSDSNIAMIRDQGDYLVFTNAVLSITLKS